MARVWWEEDPNNWCYMPRVRRVPSSWLPAPWTHSQTPESVAIQWENLGAAILDVSYNYLSP